MKNKYGITQIQRTSPHKPASADLNSEEGKQLFRETVKRVMVTHVNVIKALAKR